MSDFLYIDSTNRVNIEKLSQANLSKGLYNNYQIGNSAYFTSASATFLTRTFNTTPSTYTFSFWVKRWKLGVSQSLFFSRSGASYPGGLQFDSNDTIYLTTGPSSSTIFTTTRVFRDVGAWYHMVLSVTASGTSYFYVNGELINTFTATATPWIFVSSYTNCIARYGDNSSFDGDFYLADFYFIDGQARSVNDFGYFDNQRDFVWKPKKYTGTFGGRDSFYLNFNNSSNLGLDSSGSGNNWTATNMSSSNQTSDSPSNNFCTLNPLAGTGTSSNGNLNISQTANQSMNATMYLPTKGKWYFEFTVNTLAATNTGFWVITAHGGVFGLPVSGAYRILKGASDISVSGSGTPAAGHIMRVAYDADNGRIWFGRDTLWFSNAGNTTSDPNTASNPSFSGLTPTNDDYITISQQGGGAGACTGTFNFGQKAFAYTVPTGYKSLCTANLPVPSIKKANLYFDVKTYNGNGSVQTIGGFNFSPDFIWLKMRSTTGDHYLWDQVRGAGNTKNLITNRTNGEGYNSAYHDFSFTSDGFTITQVSSGNEVNYSGNTYVSWGWDAGSTTDPNNTSGTITSAVRSNPQAGFSIVSYTGNLSAGATVGHGLGVAPSMIIIKARVATTSWPVYHRSRGATKWLLLNSTNAESTTNQEWNNTEPTSLVFSIGNSSSNSNQSSTYIAYCFAEIEGYSKISSFTGNGSADGTFVYTGFRPRFILLKNAQNSYHWNIFDTSRNTFNVASTNIHPSDPAGDQATASLDILSNGFKLRTASYINDSSQAIIFAAFAETPFKYALAR